MIIGPDPKADSPRRKQFLGVATLLATLLLPMLSHAVPVLDQAYDPASINRLLGVGQASGLSDPDIDLAQTFTVGVTGTLTSVDLLVRREAGIVDDLLLDIRTTTGGVPQEPDTGAGVLGSLVVAAATVPNSSGFLSVDLTALGIAVTAGDVLAIVLQSDGPNPAYLWGGTSTGGYAGGATYRRFLSLDPVWNTTGAASDLAFRTFVEPAVAVTEPGTLGIMVLAFAAVFAGRRRLA